MVTVLTPAAASSKTRRVSRCIAQISVDVWGFEQRDWRLFASVAIITVSVDENPASVVSCPTVSDTACAKNVCQPTSAGNSTTYGAGGTVGFAAGSSYTLYSLHPAHSYPYYRQIVNELGKVSGTPGYGRPCASVSQRDKIIAGAGYPIVVGRTSGSTYSAQFCEAEGYAGLAKARYIRTLTPGCSGCRAVGVDTELLIDGSRVFVADVYDGHRGFVVQRYKYAGNKHFWTKSPSQASRVWRVNGIGALGDASSIVVGMAGSSPSNLTKGLAVRIGEDGSQAWVKELGSGSPWNLRDAVQADDGTVILGGWRQVNGTVTRKLLVGIDTAGKTLWTYSPTEQTSYTAVELLGRDHSGEIMWAGTRHSGGTATLVAGGIDSNGTPTFSNVVRADTSDTFFAHTLVALPKGGFTVGLKHPNGSRTDVQWLRMSTWGHATCGSAGKCSDPGLDCDDKNPCTADWCSAAKGCEHRAVDAITCGSGKVCSVGKCVVK